MKQQRFVEISLDSVERIWRTIDFAREFYICSEPFKFSMEFDRDKIPHYNL